MFSVIKQGLLGRLNVSKGQKVVILKTISALEDFVTKDIFKSGRTHVKRVVICCGLHGCC